MISKAHHMFEMKMKNESKKEANLRITSGFTIAFMMHTTRFTGNKKQSIGSIWRSKACKIQRNMTNPFQIKQNSCLAHIILLKNWQLIYAVISIHCILTRSEDRKSVV